MFYILLQTKAKGRGEDRRLAGEVWSTGNLTKNTWPPNDSLELFLGREGCEVLRKAKSYAEVRRWMLRWHSHLLKLPDFSLDEARRFFGGKRKRRV